MVRRTRRHNNTARRSAVVPGRWETLLGWVIGWSLIGVAAGQSPSPGSLVIVEPNAPAESAVSVGPNHQVAASSSNEPEHASPPTISSVYAPGAFLSDDDIGCTDGGWMLPPIEGNSEGLNGGPITRPVNPAGVSGRSGTSRWSASPTGHAGSTSRDPHVAARRTHTSPRWFGGPWVLSDRAYRDPNDPERHVGLGEPLIGTSWRNRPFSVSAFVGGVMPATLIDGVLKQRGGTALGYRVGYDFDHYLGIEFRHTFLATRSTVLNLGPDETPIEFNGLSQAGDVMFFVYPFGDSRWRPYYGVGLGAIALDVVNENQFRVRDTALTVPLAVGLKYQVWPCLAVRAELTDILSFGGADIDPENLIHLTIGTEFRFGGKRPKYYPLDTSAWTW